MSWGHVGDLKCIKWKWIACPFLVFVFSFHRWSFLKEAFFSVNHIFPWNCISLLSLMDYICIYELLLPTYTPSHCYELTAMVWRAKDYNNFYTAGVARINIRDPRWQYCKRLHFTFTLSLLLRFVKSIGFDNIYW